MNFTIASYPRALEIYQNYTWVVSIRKPGTKNFISGENVFHMEFDDIDRIPSAGYEYTLPTLEHIKQMILLGEHLSTNPQQSVLFHCQSGISRSSGMAAIALLTYHYQDIEAAVSELFEKFPYVIPNSYIVKQTDKHFRFQGKFIEQINRELKSHQSDR